MIPSKNNDPKVNEILANAKVLEHFEQEKKCEGNRFDTNNIDDNLDLREALEKTHKPCFFKKIFNFISGK